MPKVKKIPVRGPPEPPSPGLLKRHILGRFSACRHQPPPPGRSNSAFQTVFFFDIFWMNFAPFFSLGKKTQEKGPENPRANDDGSEHTTASLGSDAPLLRCHPLPPPPDASGRGSAVAPSPPPPKSQCLVPPSGPGRCGRHSAVVRLAPRGVDHLRCIRFGPLAVPRTTPVRHGHLFGKCFCLTFLFSMKFFGAKMMKSWRLFFCPLEIFRKRQFATRQCGIIPEAAPLFQPVSLPLPLHTATHFDGGV